MKTTLIDDERRLLRAAYAETERKLRTPMSKNAWLPLRRAVEQIIDNRMDDVRAWVGRIWWLTEDVEDGCDCSSCNYKRLLLAETPEELR